MARPALTLKREVAVLPRAIATSRPKLSVWVETGVPHLDYPFSYALPEEFSHTVDLGSLVSVEFNGRTLRGLVVAREEGSTSDLSLINKPLSPFPLLNPGLIETLSWCAEHWVSHPFDFVARAIPERAVTVEKQFCYSESTRAPLRKSSSPISFLQFPPHIATEELIFRRISTRKAGSKVLVILPDTTAVQRLSAYLDSQSKPHVSLVSSQNRTNLYKNYLTVAAGSTNIIIGTRNAIFAPLSGESSILVINEASEHYYDRKHPHWNVRDVAMARSRIESIECEFLGYAPSAELFAAIDRGEVKASFSQSKLDVSTFSQQHGELIPSRSISKIRTALAQGPVLFLTPSKGYSQAIKCLGCRTIAHCECGGSIIQRSANSPLVCSHCAAVFASFICVWCQGTRTYLAKRGIERFAYELGLLFPGVEMKTISADDPVLSLDDSPRAILATSHMAPRVPRGYVAVVILEGNRFLAQADFRAQERVRSLYFESAALVRKDGAIIIIQDEGHPIATSLTRWSITAISASELEQLKSLALPPYATAAILDIGTSSVSSIKTAFTSSIGKVAPSTLRIYGPTLLGDGRSRLIFMVPRSDAHSLISLLHEFLKKRSASKKELPSISIDPYTLSPE